jgi:hypothetical protein
VPLPLTPLSTLSAGCHRTRASQVKSARFRSSPPRRRAKKGIWARVSLERLACSASSPGNGKTR